MRNLTVQYRLMFRLRTVWKTCANQGIRHTIAYRNTSWRAAESFCKSLGGGSYLATPRNAQQSQCIEELTQMISTMTKTAWIGLQVKDGTVYYTDNNQTQKENVYTNWKWGQAKQHKQQCVTVYKSSRTGKSGWISMNCGEPYHAVCQRPGEFTQVQFTGHNLLISFVNRVQSCHVLFQLEFFTCDFLFPALCSVTCPDLNLFGLAQQPNHSLHGGNFYGNGPVNVKCRRGFWSPWQNSTLTCTENGHWQPKPKKCQPINCAELNATTAFLQQSTKERYKGTVLMEYKCKEGFQDVNNYGKRQIEAEKKYCFVNGSIDTALSDSCRSRPAFESGNDAALKCLDTGSSTEFPLVCKGIKPLQVSENKFKFPNPFDSPSLSIRTFSK